LIVDNVSFSNSPSMTTVTLTELNIYPVKSCGGIALREAALAATGLEHDRTFMVVHADTGRFVSQRTHPQMAVVKSEIKFGQVVLRAPGMVRMDLPLDTAGDDLQVTVWQDSFMACDMGSVAATWFSQILGIPVRLARFNPDVTRAVSERYNPGIAASTEFADGYPLLVLSAASLTNLNERLAEKHIDPVPMNRFRPNIVIDGIHAFEEDYIDTITFGDAVIKLVKPCARCEIPNTDQTTAERYAEPGRTLAEFRMLENMHGQVCVGMNAIVLQGAGAQLAVGQRGTAALRF
jgi:uncharacterized protein